MNHIDTERLQLRFPLTDADPRHIEWLNDKDLMRWSEQRWREHDYDTQREFLVDALVAGNPICFDIILIQIAGEDFGRSIGTIHTYLDKRHRRADLGIMLGLPYHGKGYAAEAWRAVEDYLIKDHQIEKFEGGCAAVNQPMVKLFNRLDYYHEGTRFCHFMIDNEKYDLFLWGKQI